MATEMSSSGAFDLSLRNCCELEGRFTAGHSINLTRYVRCLGRGQEYVHGCELGRLRWAFQRSVRAEFLCLLGVKRHWNEGRPNRTGGDRIDPDVLSDH